MTTREVTVRARFETGHRLPQLPGKCRHLHGHSWQAWITAEGELDETGVIVDFSLLKNKVQEWVDEHFDHGMLLGADDPLSVLLLEQGLKVHRFGVDAHTDGLRWPTVEAVAETITRVTESLVAVRGLPVRVSRVAVQETENNRAEVTR